jgi:hypothetical protein
MINCFIDPIFLTIKDNFDYYDYLEKIFIKLSDFFDKIEDLERFHRVRFLKININQYFLDECIKKNPFKSKDNKLRYEFFLSEILRFYVNSNCEDKYIYNFIENPKFLFENRNISDSMMNYWNSYINQCAKCEFCKDIPHDLLTSRNFGIEMKKGTNDFFSNKYDDWIAWLVKRLLSAKFLDVFPNKQDNPERKTKIFQFLINIYVFIQNQVSRIDQEYEILKDFWDSDFIYTNDHDFRVKVIEVMSNILLDPDKSFYRKHKLHHQQIRIEGKNKDLFQYDIFQEYRLDGVDITPRLIVAFHEQKVFFYKIINRHV